MGEILSGKKNEENFSDLPKPLYKYTGVGRRKRAVAKVSIYGFSSLELSTSFLNITNNFHRKHFRLFRTVNQYFHSNSQYINNVMAPLKMVEAELQETKYLVCVNTHGGGLKSQSEAIKLAIARAFCFGLQSEPIKNVSRETILNNIKKSIEQLRLEGFLKVDARRKERKKYGLKKARKASQFSKR